LNHSFSQRFSSRYESTTEFQFRNAIPSVHRDIPSSPELPEFCSDKTRPKISKFAKKKKKKKKKKTVWNQCVKEQLAAYVKAEVQQKSNKKSKQNYQKDLQKMKQTRRSKTWRSQSRGRKQEERPRSLTRSRT
jgi:hypothetical protein